MSSWSKTRLRLASPAAGLGDRHDGGLDPGEELDPKARADRLTTGHSFATSVSSVMVDWNYDGAVLQPAVVDLPAKDELVSGEYEIPEDAGTIRVKITDLLSESLEAEVSFG